MAHAGHGCLSVTVAGVELDIIFRFVVDPLPLSIAVRPNSPSFTMLRRRTKRVFSPCFAMKASH